MQNISTCDSVIRYKRTQWTRHQEDHKKHYYPCRSTHNWPNIPHQTTKSWKIWRKEIQYIKDYILISPLGPWYDTECHNIQFPCTNLKRNVVYQEINGLVNTYKKTKFKNLSINHHCHVILSLFTFEIII